MRKGIYYLEIEKDPIPLKLGINTFIDFYNMTGHHVEQCDLKEPNVMFTLMYCMARVGFRVMGREMVHHTLFDFIEFVEQREDIVEAFCKILADHEKKKKRVQAKKKSKWWRRFTKLFAPIGVG